MRHKDNFVVVSEKETTTIFCRCFENKGTTTAIFCRCFKNNDKNLLIFIKKTQKNCRCFGEDPFPMKNLLYLGKKQALLKSK